MSWGRPKHKRADAVFSFLTQAFDDNKAAGRIANMGLEKLGAISAGLGDKINDNADKALNKARAMDVS